jgi:hypothetical protein
MRAQRGGVFEGRHVALLKAEGFRAAHDVEPVGDVGLSEVRDGEHGCGRKLMPCLQL